MKHQHQYKSSTHHPHHASNISATTDVSSSTASITEAKLQQTYLSALVNDTAIQQRRIEMAIDNISKPPEYPGQVSVCEGIEPEMHYLSPHSPLDWVSLEYVDAKLWRYMQTCEYAGILLDEELRTNLRHWDAPAEDEDAKPHPAMLANDDSYDSIPSTPMDVDTPHFSHTSPSRCRVVDLSPHFSPGTPNYRGWVTPDYIKAHFAQQRLSVMSSGSTHRPVMSLTEKLAEVSGPPRSARTIKQIAQGYRRRS